VPCATVGVWYAVCVMPVGCHEPIWWCYIMVAPLRQASSSSLRWTPWAFTRATSTRPKLVRPSLHPRQPPPPPPMRASAVYASPLAFGLVTAHHRGRGR
jgi:hypothetical protein